MNSRVHLHPTVTVDKNGKLTTVYKRAAEEAPSMAIPAPAPAPSPRDDRDLIEEFTAVIGDSVDFDDEEQFDHLRETLSEYSHGLIDRLDDVMGTDGSIDHLTATMIGNAEGETVVSACLEFVPELGEDGWDSEELSAAIDSLHHYPHLKQYDDYGLADEQTKQQAIALLRVSHAMSISGEDARAWLDYPVNNWGNSSPVLSDERSVELVMEHSDEAGKLVEAISGAKTHNYDFLHAVIQNKNVALTDGTL